MSQTNVMTDDTGKMSARTSGSQTPSRPMWQLGSQWAHFGERLEDAMREAVDSPGSFCQHKRAAGQQPTAWDFINDIASVLERV